MPTFSPVTSQNVFYKKDYEASLEGILPAQIPAKTNMQRHNMTSLHMQAIINVIHSILNKRCKIQVKTAKIPNKILDKNDKKTDKWFQIKTPQSNSPVVWRQK